MTRDTSQTGQMHQLTQAVSTNGDSSHAAEEKFARLFDASPDALIICRQGDESILEVNEGFERLLGYGRAEALGRTLVDLDVYVDPVDRQRLSAELAAQGFVRDLEVDVCASTGEVRRVNVRVEAVVSHGQPGWLTILRDVTPHIQIEDALLPSKARLPSLVDYMPAAVYTCDSDGMITYYNQRAAELWGRRPEIGEPDEKFCGSFRLYWPDGTPLPHDETPMAVAVQTGKRTHQDEVVIEKPDGTILYVTVNIDPLYDKDGRQIGAINVFEDITGRKQLEERLRRSEEEQRTLMEVMPTAMFTCDSDGLITYYNQRAAELWGRRPKLKDPEDKFCGSFRIYRPDGSRLPHHLCPMALAVLTGRGTRNEEIHIERPDGKTILASVNIDALYDQAGRRIGAINVFEDVTARKEAEVEREQLLIDLAQEQAKLKQLTETLEERVEWRTKQVRELAAQLTLAEERERDRIARILHDHIQQMLYGVQWRTNLLEQDMATQNPDSLQAHIDEMKRLSEQAIHATRTLSVELSPPILENEGLPEAISWLANQMKDVHDLDVEQVIEGDCQVQDPSLRGVIFQVVRELLFNVVKHAEVNRAVVSLRQTNGQLVAIVQDEGQGFDPSSVSTENIDRTGLGLSSVRERLQLFNGSMEVRSEPGKGTQVTTVLPLSGEGE